MNKNAEALIEDEFGCYYLADELDNVNGPSFLARIDEMAAESAQRIVWSGGPESAAPVSTVARVISKTGNGVPRGHFRGGRCGRSAGKRNPPARQRSVTSSARPWLIALRER